jgi:hypothetical protein
VWGPIEVLSPSGRVSKPQVAIDADGNAVVTWLGNTRRDDALHARARSTTGARGPIQTVSGGGQSPSDPPHQIAVAADGKALIVWRHGPLQDQQIRARALSPSGDLGPVEVLSRPAGQWIENYHVAMNANGDVLVAWDVWGLVPDTGVQVRVRSATGELGSRQILTRSGRYPHVAINASGNALVAWQISGGRPQNLVQARTRSVSGDLGPVQTLSHDRQIALSPQAAVDAAGGALVVWYRDDDDVPRRVQGAIGP